MVHYFQRDKQISKSVLFNFIFKHDSLNSNAQTQKTKSPDRNRGFSKIPLASPGGCLIGQATRILLVWCRRGDLNPHRDYSPLDPESSASANSATSAFSISANSLKIDLNYIIFFQDKVKSPIVIPHCSTNPDGSYIWNSTPQSAL